MSQNKNLDASINTFTFNNCNNFELNQVIIITPDLTQDDVKVVSIEDIEEKAKHLEILASVSSILANISPLLLPFILSLFV